MSIFCCRICNSVEFKTGKNQKVCLSDNCQREDSRIRTQEYRRRKAKKENRLDRVDIGKGMVNQAAMTPSTIKQVLPTSISWPL